MYVANIYCIVIVLKETKKPFKTVFIILCRKKMAVHFGFNIETAKNNAFQNKASLAKHKNANQKAQKEFDLFVSKLEKAGISVDVWEDRAKPVKPDAIFPNNWISFHQDDSIGLYPMNARSRRKERDPKIVNWIKSQYQVEKIVDFTAYERESIFLEGTGSLILDRVNKVAYACLSPRTDDVLMDRFCKLFGYKKRLFSAVDQKGMDIYHTNVMMAMGNSFVVICNESIPNKNEWEVLEKQFKKNNKDTVNISWKQMNQFAGNMLLLKDAKGKNVIVMSTRAHKSLSAKQIKQLKSHGQILHSDIRTIEDLGGGSVRCMMAEVFLNLKTA